MNAKSAITKLLGKLNNARFVRIVYLYKMGPLKKYLNVE